MVEEIKKKIPVEDVEKYGVKFINMPDLELLQQVNLKGSYGDVFKGRFRKQFDCAIKKNRLTDLSQSCLQKFDASDNR